MRHEIVYFLSRKFIESTLRFFVFGRETKRFCGRGMRKFGRYFEGKLTNVEQKLLGKWIKISVKIHFSTFKKYFRLLSKTTISIHPPDDIDSHENYKANWIYGSKEFQLKKIEKFLVFVHNVHNKYKRSKENLKKLSQKFNSNFPSRKVTTKHFSDLLWLRVIVDLFMLGFIKRFLSGFTQLNPEVWEFFLCLRIIFQTGKPFCAFQEVFRDEELRAKLSFFLPDNYNFLNAFFDCCARFYFPIHLVKFNFEKLKFLRFLFTFFPLEKVYKRKKLRER